MVSIQIAKIWTLFEAKAAKQPSLFFVAEHTCFYREVGYCPTHPSQGMGFRSVLPGINSALCFLTDWSPGILLFYPIQLPSLQRGFWEEGLGIVETM